MMKRIFDVVVSFIFIILLSPLFLLIALLIKLDSKGSPIYVQCRVGLNNIDFSILKFRTMHVHADKKGLITIGGRDPRVTRIGYYLRKYKLDELPQIFNVFFGEMSFVGPRPEVRKYVDLYNAEQQKVLAVKPGITDYASIEYSKENELLAKTTDPEATYINEIMPAKLKLNLKYLEEHNFFVDIRILMKTIFKIIRH